MARALTIVIAWDLGSNWGHLATLLPIARRLRELGHDVLFAVRGVDADLSTIGAEGFDHLPMPVPLDALRRLQAEPVFGYVDVLARCGFGDARALWQAACSWEALLRRVGADVVLCKYAPLAEFATRRVPVMAIGTGFDLHPLTAPLPVYRQMDGAQATAVRRTGQGLLSSINEVLARMGQPAVATVGEAFAHATRVFTTVPQLDHFGERPGAVYVGPAEDFPVNAAARETARAFVQRQTGQVNFAYLRVGRAWIEAFAAECRRLDPGQAWVLVDPTLGEAQVPADASAPVLTLTSAVDARAWADRLGSVVCHGGHGTVAMALGLGKRLLMLPTHPEQLLVVRRALAWGQGHGVLARTWPCEPAVAATVVQQLVAMPEPPALPMPQANAANEVAARLTDLVEQG